MQLLSCLTPFRLFSVVVAWLVLNGGALLRAQPVSVLHTFDQGSEGIQNSSPLIQGQDGRLYGGSISGGKYQQGAVYAMNPDGSDFVVLHHMNGSSDDGTGPFGGVIQGSDGRLYGTAYNGSGTVFALNPDGSNFAVLYRFGGLTGNTPYAGLLEGTDGRLYGAASAGGANFGGTIFALNRDGTGFVVLRNLTSLTDGSTPRGTLIQGADGRLYGTASEGGANGAGTIFALNPNGSGFTVLRHLTTTTDGGTPYAGLIQGLDGRLYGVNRNGGMGTSGPSSYGTIFALQIDGTGYTVLKAFENSQIHSIWPQGRLVQMSDGRLIGTTYFQSGSVIFSVRPDGTSYSVLRVLNNDEGYFLNAGLIVASDGRLYGAAQGGGIYANGTVFRLNVDGSNFAVLRHSDYRARGIHPSGRLFEGANGKFYGTTREGAFDAPGTSAYGGASRFGTLFSMDRDGANFTVLHNFVGNSIQTSNPLGGVVPGGDGRLYGSMSGGQWGRGALYAIQPDGTGFSVVHDFGDINPDGTAPPVGELVKGADGRFYGMTSESAPRLFVLNANGSGYALLRTLNFGSEGGVTQGARVGLALGSDGRLYGMTSLGGNFNRGTIFVLGSGGTEFAVLHHFQAALHGGIPFDTLIEGSDGRLYGVNSQEGPSSGGTIFSLKKYNPLLPNDTDFRVVRAFSAPIFASRGGIVEGLDGRIYGTTALGSTAGNSGTLFAVKKDGTGFSVVHNFTPAEGSITEEISLMRGSDGSIYGTSRRGGPYFLSGMLFSYTPPLPPVITSPLVAGGIFNQPFNYSITASSNPTDFDALNLPAAFSINHATGLISGLPQTTGVFPVDIAASNSVGIGVATLSLTIAKATAPLTLGNLTQTYDGSPKIVSVTSVPAGLAADVLYEGSVLPPVDAGSYGVVATVNNPNYSGTSVGVLNILPAAATVTLGNLTHIFDGAPKVASVTTVPTGLPVSVAYNGGAAAPANAGSYPVTATVTSPNYSGSDTETLTIAPAPATVTFANLAQVYDGTAKPVSIATLPPGLPVAVTYNGLGTAPINAGAYAVAGVVTNPNYHGSATGALVVAKAAASVALMDTVHVYDGTPKSVTATTMPAGLATTITYDGSTTAPAAAGSYAVVATIDAPNYSGSTTGTLTIGQAAATVTIGNLLQAFDGQPKPVTVTTTPQGLPVTVTYDGAATPPSAIGTYTVNAVIAHPNYSGSRSAQLKIAAAGTFAIFIPLGDLPGGAFTSVANGVSADGKVVTGWSMGASGREAFRWTSAGMQALGELAGGNFESTGLGLSADGSVIVGESAVSGGKEAFRWSGDTLAGLGELSGGQVRSTAYALSADGSVIVGESSGTAGGEAVRWTAAGLERLGDLSGGAFDSEATGVSADGSVIVGSASSGAGREAFRWTAAGGMVGLGDLPGGSVLSIAQAVSGDGKVVVGVGRNDIGAEAFRWTSATGMVGLGHLPSNGGLSSAKATSATGNVIVGSSAGAEGTEAFVWMNHTGMRRLRETLLLDYGVTELAGWQFTDATGVSADGRWIAGTGRNPAGDFEAWLAFIPLTIPPAITSPLSAGGQVAVPFSYQIATDGTPSSYTATGLPAGLSLDAATGSISGTPSVAGTFAISLGAVSSEGNGAATLTLTIAKGNATITLGNLEAVYDGTPKAATATTSPAGLSVTITPFGDKINAGGYGLFATINDANYAGTASGTLVIKPAPVTLANLSHTYDGTAKEVTAITSAPGLHIAFFYGGSPTPPTNAGSYLVTSSISGPNPLNFLAPAAATMVIEKASQTVAFDAIGDQVFGAAPIPVGATATSSLPVQFSVVSGPATVAGNLVTLTGAGTVVMRATQPGNINYLPASAERTFQVAKGTAQLRLANIVQPFDGTPKPVAVITVPAGLATTVSYAGSASVPSAKGGYAVAATVVDPNYQGTAQGTLTIHGDVFYAPLGNLGGQFLIAVSGVSNNGVVVGRGIEGVPDSHAFRWSNSTGSQAIPNFTPETFFSDAHGISGDGSIVVGMQSSPTTSMRAFRWTETGGTMALNQLPSQSDAIGISADGSTIVGTHGVEAFRWTESGGKVALGDLPGGEFRSFAKAASANGAVIVGYSGSALGNEAFRWTQAGGMVGLGGLPGGNFDSFATGVSADGSVVVGRARTANGFAPFRWTQAEGMVELGSLSALGVGVAYAVSGDGRVVVGESAGQAFIWTAATGMRNLRDVLINDYGLGAEFGSRTLQIATAISPNGRFVAGYGFNPMQQRMEAFLVALPPLPTAPSITSALTAGGTVAQSFAYTVTADGNPTNFGALNLPAGLSINPATGVISGSPSAAGTFSVTLEATNAGGTGTATLAVTIAKAAATVTLGNLAPTYDGTPKAVTTATVPASLPVSVTYNGSATAPTNAGSYAVVATVNDANYAGSTSGTLVIKPAAVLISNLPQTYDGTAKGVTVQTSAPGLVVTVSYAPTNPPINAGNYLYTVALSGLNAPNFAAPPAGTLVIAPAAANVALADLTQSYTGSPRAVAVTTTPAGLATSVTYNGSATVPTNAGSYAVVATVTNPNYVGSASGTLTVGKANASVAISNTTHVFDGTPKSVTVTTTPVGLSAVVTYDGSTTAPTAVGSYAVAASVQNANYAGLATGTLTITAGAITATVDRTITLSPNQISSATDDAGNSGQMWRVEFPISPVTLKDGDTIRGTLAFANSEGLRIADSGAGFLQQGTVKGFEQVAMEFGTGGPSVLSTYAYSIGLQGASGSPLVPIQGPNALSVYPGFATATTFNLVNPGSSYYLRGINYEHRINTGGPHTIQSIVVWLRAAQIDVIPQSYMDWAVVRVAPNLNQPATDAERDGLPNLLEYFSGTSPAVPTPDVHTAAVENGELAFRFQRDTSATGLTYRVAVSADLINWSDAPVAPMIESTAGSIVRYVVRLPMTAQKLFARLEVAMAGTTVATAPFGYQRFAIPGGTAPAPGSTAFGVPFHRVEPPSQVRVGRIDAFTASTITSQSAVWSADLVNPATPWYVRLRSGPAAGKTLPITAVATASATLTVSGANLTTLGLVAGDTSFEIIRGETLMSRFGSTTLLGGTSASVADNVMVHNGTNSLAYYYDTNLGFWRRTIGPATNSNNVKIAPDAGVEIQRRGPATSLVFTGQVATTPFRVAINNSGTTYLHTGYPMDTTLLALGMQTLPGWRIFPTEPGSDLLLLGSTLYFFNGTYWQDVSSTANRDAVPIPAGTIIRLLRPGTASGTVDFVRPLPYSP